MSAQERNVLAELTLLQSVVAELRENMRELREDVRGLREEVRHDLRELREDVRGIRNGQLAFAVALVVGLLGLIATLLVKL